jgi:eukaryotic-like serine/threonine-protein kinase
MGIEPGTRLRNYEILSQLGSGGLGVVYRAFDTHLQRPVAIKILNQASAQNEEHKNRMLREARIVSSLTHPHICTVYEIVRDPDITFIVMEFIEGSTLRHSIPQGGLSTELVLRYGGQMTAALAHAHDRGIIHRDLKSANVVITPDGRSKILDFDLASRILPERDQEQSPTRSLDSLAQDGVVAGTLPYMSPEVLRGQRATPASDLWALGVLLYEMATGMLPFSGETLFEISSSILNDGPRAFPQSVPQPLRDVINRCLSKETAQRYGSAEEMRAALEDIAQKSNQQNIAQIGS